MNCKTKFQSIHLRATFESSCCYKSSESRIYIYIYIYINFSKLLFKTFYCFRNEIHADTIQSMTSALNLFFTRGIE